MDQRDPEPAVESVAESPAVEPPAPDAAAGVDATTEPEIASSTEPVAEANAEPQPVERHAEAQPVEAHAEAQPVEEHAEAQPVETHAEPEPVEASAESDTVEPHADPVAEQNAAGETSTTEAVARESQAPTTTPVDSDAHQVAFGEPALTPPAPTEPALTEPAPTEPAAATEAPAPAPVDPRRMRAQQAWERVVAAHANGDHVTGMVTAAVKGGLLVDVGGIRGFLPASQVRVPIGTALESLVKTKVPLKVLDVDAGRRRIVVSQRRAVDEERRTKRSELLRSLEVGQIREAVVARLADFGAFVDLGGVDGLIPMRELAFERVEKTSDAVNVGDRVTVQVLRIEEGGKKIALSRKNALPDPWRDHAALLRNGTAVEGRVVAKEPNLIVELAPGITGSVRSDEADPDDYELGEAIEVTVRSVDRVRRRIMLTTMHAAAAAAAAAAAPQTSPTTTSGFAPLGVELAQRKK
jgi:small subunit ribosomal protein S1